MEDNEEVVEQATEKLVDGAVSTNEAVTNIDTVEEKTYTQADIDKLVNEQLNKILPSKIERAKAKISREYEEKYERTNRVLKAGLGVESIEEATDQLEEFYTNKGIKIPEKTFSDSDMNYLAERYADEVISEGYDEVVKEVDRLSRIGDGMTQQQKLMFMKLAENRKKQEELKELASIGIGQKELEDKGYIDFANKLNPNLSAKEKYELYKQFEPKENIEQIGSMKNTNKTKEVKEYYTPDEARRLTSEDLDDPQIMAAVEKSMAMWYNNK